MSEPTQEHERELLCICDAALHPDWMAHVWVDGELVLSQLIDSRVEDVGTVSRAHVDLIEQAEKEGRTWRADIRCPVCGGGNLFSPEGMVEMAGVAGIERAFVIGAEAHEKICATHGTHLKRSLNVLSKAENADDSPDYTPVTIPSNSIWCGHDLVGSPPTHALLGMGLAEVPEVDIHLIFCVECAHLTGALG